MNVQGVICLSFSPPRLVGILHLVLIVHETLKEKLYHL